MTYFFVTNPILMYLLRRNVLRLMYLKKYVTLTEFFDLLYSCKIGVK
jgi:hypothetical protein